MSDSKQFLKDIGLEYDKDMAALVEAINNKPMFPPVVSNILNLPAVIRMDDPMTASYMHIRNLIRTYGVDVVKEAMSEVTKDEL